VGFVVVAFDDDDVVGASDDGEGMNCFGGL